MPRKWMSWSHRWLSVSEKYVWRHLCEKLYETRKLDSKLLTDHRCCDFAIIKCFFTVKRLPGYSSYPFDSCNWYLQQVLLLRSSDAENLIELSSKHMHCMLLTARIITRLTAKWLSHSIRVHFEISAILEAVCSCYLHLSQLTILRLRNVFVRIGRSRSSWYDNIKIKLRETVCFDVNSILRTHDRIQGRVSVLAVINLPVI
jgi:hypothetical protein